MGKIVFAAGAPHAPAIVGLFDRAPDEAKQVVTDTYKAITKALKAAKPDVMIAFANDHLANSRITFYPDFLIGTAAEHTGPYERFQEWIGCRDYSTKGNPDVAKALFQGMTRRGIRMSARHENSSSTTTSPFPGGANKPRPDRHHSSAGAAELHCAALSQS